MSTTMASSRKKPEARPPDHDQPAEQVAPISVRPDHQRWVERLEAFARMSKRSRNSSILFIVEDWLKTNGLWEDEQ